MCGICGIVGFADVELVTQMRDLLTYRGPDEAGLYRREHAVLGVRRLSTIDPDGGQQPLFNEDGSVVVVCNGEIYNRRSMRQELEHAGHTFTSRGRAFSHRSP
jgi:asparagine synthase (glutamine-hydrolysing)